MGLRGSRHCCGPRMCGIGWVVLVVCGCGESETRLESWVGGWLCCTDRLASVSGWLGEGGVVMWVEWV
jgi:hypothetical protein